MARIVVTGGAGFIGTALRAALGAAGHEVLRADVRDGCELVADVTRTSDCERLCRGADVVVHGAAIHRADAVRARPAAAIRVNVEGTGKLLRAAAAAGVGRFVMLSTAKVYGDTGSAPVAESAWPRPADVYGLSKLGAEDLVRRANLETGLRACVLRPFSVYGPGQDLDTGYVGMLLTALRDDAPVALPGAPHYLRDFVYIGDLVELVARVIEAASLPPFLVLNAASGVGSRLDALARLFTGLAGGGLEVGYREAAPGTLAASVGAVDRAAELLGHVAGVSLEAGLRATLDWAATRGPAPAMADP